MLKNCWLLVACFTSFSALSQEQKFKSGLEISDVKSVLKAVADWQISTPLTHDLADWTNGALYAGMVEWAAIAGDNSYYEWLKSLAEKNGWSYLIRKNPLGKYHADDYCVGQTYIELYRKYKDRNMINPMKAYLDKILKKPATGDLKFVNTDSYWSTQRWSWCDALFMGPTVWAKMANVTGRKKYLDFMYKEYKATTDYLYDQDEHLFFRDSNYFTRKEANGAKVFWGRGNGWVFAGLPVIIKELPAKYEHKDFFVTIYKDMAARLLALQSADGFWHASLLDPSSYPNPEMSATAFFVYGMAWGVNNGLLDRGTYLPAIEKGWKSMVTSVWPDGKVGFIQPIGADPKSVTRDMTEVYGVGGFLMAGTEITRLDTVSGQGFLKADGKRIVNEKGENILLRGIGLGGWMLQEPYMLQLSDVAGTQTEIKARISELIGQKNCDEFYTRYLQNMITEKDIDALKQWGFNSIRLPMHYNLYTLPIEKEPVAGQNTWLETGFRLTDNLLSWCRKNKIYLILDLHAAPGGQGNDRPIADVDTLKPNLWESEANQKKTIALWKKLAERYKDEEWIGGYDLINETNYKLEANEPLRRLFTSITTEIRKSDRKHIIFIEGNQFANDYTGLTPPWDNNMVYSFHKYWNPATIETIQKYLDMRAQYNVPFWMGESGENTNEWFRAAVNLFESNNIGWAWWTIKKIGSESSLMTISTPAGYQKIIDYWAGKGTKPTQEEALATFMQLAENVKFEKCSVNHGVIDALFSKQK